uniref:hypothetical protein n=1 Tax=Salinibacter ruber TaxID=146919 RepID=UPI002073D94B
MLFLVAAAAAAGILAYYFFGGEKTEEPKQASKQTGPKGTANRNRALDRQAPGETGPRTSSGGEEKRSWRGSPTFSPS